MLNKKTQKNTTQLAAMFGLDARIALAIFGALSVITGVALYSTIKKANLIALISELNEVGKSYDQYYLDTGEELPLSASVGYLDIINLIKKPANVSNWKGPYIPFGEDSGKTHLLKHKTTYSYNVYIEESKNAKWAGTTNVEWGQARCAVMSNLKPGDCGVWISAYFPLANEKIVMELDKMIDKTIDGTDGNFRWFLSGGTSYYGLFKYRNSYRY